MKRCHFEEPLLCGLICAVFVSLIGFSKSCEEMYDKIIRIRIIANSNSAKDQNLKIKVRDAVLNSSEDLYLNVSSYDDAVMLTDENSAYLLNVAKNTIVQNGFDYPVTVELRDEFFETRVYDEFTLPAGSYKISCATDMTVHERSVVLGGGEVQKVIFQ